MTESPRIGLTGSLREAVVIVASILVAFGLDAWWENRGDLRAERELLVTLREEFEGTLGASQRMVQVHQQALDAATLMINEARSPMPGGQPIQVPDTILYRFMYSGTMNQSTGALDAALRGGRLGLIESDDLRAALASWPGDFEDVMVDESNAAGQMLRMVGEGFHTAGDISHISQNLASYASGSLTAEQLAVTTELTPNTQLVGDLGIRVLTLSAVLNAHSTLQRRTEAVLALLDSELNE